MTDEFYARWAVGSEVVASIFFVIAMVVIYNRFVAPAVLKGVERKNADLAESERRRDEMKAKVDEAHGEARNAERDVTEIGVRAERDAASIGARIVSDAEAEGRRVQRAAEGELERSRSAAREKMRVEIVNKAVAIARENALRLDDAANKRLVGDVVAKEGTP